MGFTSLQVSMDSSDWLQGTIHEEAGMDSSPSLSGDILTCSRPPLMERRVRPQHDQALKCPRCDSTHTKFCYYNNYSLSQPRYFCKTCRRYWTKGGTLRNIPVGGGCRKNKKVSSKKSSNDHPQPQPINQNHPGPSPSSSKNPIDLQLSFPAADAQFSNLCGLLGSQGGGLTHNAGFMDTKYGLMLENPGPIDFMENKYEALVGHGDYGVLGAGVVNDVSSQGLATNFPGLCSPFAMSCDVNNATIMDTSDRLMLPYESHENQATASLDVKPNPKLLSLEWHDQACSDHAAGKDTFGCIGGLGSWTGFMNGYGSSATNPLV